MTRTIPGPTVAGSPVRKRPGTTAPAGFLALVATVLLVAGAAAQDVETLKPFDLPGQVVDSAGTPLVGAFVALLGDDSGYLSDEDGRFDVEDIFPGRLALTVELIGYETLEWSGEATSTDSLSLTLIGRPEILAGLELVMERLDRRRRSSSRPSRAFGWERLATTSTRSALAFLTGPGGLSRIRCSRSFTSECVSVGGRAVEPVVWLDEARVVGGLDYLSNMEPHELYLLEVYSSGRHIRGYTPFFMERAAEIRLEPLPLIF